jgi:AcrR family transcriptional regulator
MNQDHRRTAHEISGVKARAMTAAARILAEHGREALSLRAIAESAQVGIASIYHYFSSKEELLLSLAVAGFESLRREIATADATREAVRPIGQGAQAFFAFAGDNAELFSLMYDVQMLSRHESLREAEHQAFLTFREYVASDGRFPPDAAPGVAAALWALGRGIAAITSSQPDGKLSAEQAETIFAGAGYLLNRG